jgi:hypothetical protein
MTTAVTLKFPAEAALAAQLEKDPRLKNEYLQQNGVIARAAEIFANRTIIASEMQAEIVNNLRARGLEASGTILHLPAIQQALRACAKENSPAQPKLGDAIALAAFTAMAAALLYHTFHQ